MFSSRPAIVNQWSRWKLTVPRAMSRLLAATLFPPRCCLCGFEGESLDLDLCGICRDDLPINGPRGDGLIPFRYAPPVDHLVRQLKYHGVIPHARVLGVLLAQAARERGLLLPRMLIPVPLHAARMRERGFNQALAIARFASRMLEIPVAGNVVRRVRNTPSQTTLDPIARRLNLGGAFAIPEARQQRRLLEARHVALIDDVMTTGCTLRELRRVLRDAGVSRVDLWAVAQAS